MSAQLLGGDDVLIAAVARQWRGKHPLANSARVVTSRNRRLLPDAEDEKGWPDSAYAVSKIAAFAFTLIVGREEYFAKSRVLVNAVCPGYVARSLAHRRLRTRCGGGAVARGGDLRTRWPYLLAAKRQRATLVWCLRQVLLHATDDAHGRSQCSQGRVYPDVACSDGAGGAGDDIRPKGHHWPHLP